MNPTWNKNIGVQVRGFGRPAGSDPHCTVIDTTSASLNWTMGLSPFHLGPCPLYDGYVAQKMENAWQFSKLYAQHSDGLCNPTAEYWRWAQQGWSDMRAHRYPMGRGAKPVCSIWNGYRHDYISARKNIYCPLYCNAVKTTVAWQQLKALTQNNIPILLLDYDGYQSDRSLHQILHDPTRIMGHAFVLAMMLCYGEDVDFNNIPVSS